MVDPESKQWPKHSRNIRTRLGMHQDLSPWIQGKQKELRGLKATDLRIRDVVDVSWWYLRSMGKYRHLSDSELMKDAFVNVSQNPHYTPVSRGLVGTLLQNSIIYSLEHDCVLSAVAHAMCIGWPADFFPSSLVSAHEVRGLVGESFSVPCACLIYSCVVMLPTAAWWQHGR